MCVYVFWLPLVIFIVIEWTYTTSWTLILLLTLLDFIIVRMKLTFLPTMTTLTQIALWTTLLISGQEVLIIPFTTVQMEVVVLTRWSSEILPIVSIDTFRFIMFTIIEWTPLGFIMKDIEVIIHLVIVDQLSLHL